MNLPRANPWPKPLRTEQAWAQVCYTLLGGTPLDGYALQNAKICLPLNNYPGSGNQAFLRRVSRYGASVRLGGYYEQAASGCEFAFAAQADPRYGFLNLVNRNEATRGHLGLWMLAAGAAWVIATQEDKGKYAEDIADESAYWFTRLYGLLDLLSYKGVVLGVGWRDEADLESKDDDTLRYFRGQPVKRRPKEWTNLTDGGYSVLYQLLTMRVLQDLKCLMPKMNPEPLGIPVKVYSSSKYDYINEAGPIVPRNEIFRWSYRVTKGGAIEMQKQIGPTTVTRPSEKDCPFVTVGQI